MADLSTLSDSDLHAKLVEYGMSNIPLTKTTRDVVIRRLKSVMDTGNGTAHEETVENRTSTRRRSMVKSKSSKRTSIVSTPSQTDPKTDDSDCCEPEKSEFTVQKPKLDTPQSNRKSVNGRTSRGSLETTASSDHLSDEELMNQLAKFKIPFPTITYTTRPLLIKKLNHAMAKSRRESKLFSPPKPVVKDTEEEDKQESDNDCMDNANFLSAWERRNMSPLLSYSKQHSLTLGNHSSLLLNESIPKPPCNIVNRFVEEQEPYDTGSDSETDSAVNKGVSRRSWNFSSLFPSKLYPNTVIYIYFK